MASIVFGKKPRHASRSAYTLTEIVIVLGIMGFVLAAIWLVAGTVWNNHKLYRARQQIMAIVENMRDYYGPSGRPLPPDGTIMTPIASTNGLIPSDMITGGNFVHALGGVFFLVSVNSTGSVRLEFFGLTKETCVKMLMQFPVLAPELGVSRIGANGNLTAVNTANISDPGGGVTLPLTLADASGRCGVVGTGNEVDIDFRIRN